MIKTPNYMIRKIAPHDVSDYFEILSCEETAHKAGLKPTNDFQTVQYLITSMIFEDNIYVIENNHKVIGSIGLYKDIYHSACNCVEVGFLINKKYQGIGVMSECLKYVIDDLFAHDYEMISLLVFTDNVASIRLADKFRFSNDGVLKNFKKLYNNEIKNVFIYTLERGVYERHIKNKI